MVPMKIDFRDKDRKNNINESFPKHWQLLMGSHF